MELNPIAERCGAMSVKELLRATTVDASDYGQAFHIAAHSELSRRGMEAYRLRDQARLFLPDGTVHGIRVATISEMLPRQFAEGAMLGFENCIGDHLVFQRHGAEWVVYHSSEGDFRGSLICPSDDVMRAIAGRFVRLEDWSSGLDHDIPESDLVMVEPSRTMDYARRAADALKADGIEARAVPDVTRASCRGTCTGAPQYGILVPAAHAARARIILDGLHEDVERLHREAAEHAERGDAIAELAAYEEILIVAPDDEIALFNRGALLVEARRYGEALDCLAPLIGRVDEETMADVRDYLQEILKASPSLPLLHTLADIERGRGDIHTARHHLETALQMDEGHPITHLALAYQLYEDEGNDTTAALHFRRYLELMPGAEDREAIEMILDEMDERQQ